MRVLRYAFLLMAGVVSPALAEPFVFSGTGQLRAGFGSNPFLNTGDNEKVGVVGINVTPQLTRTTGRGVTTLTGTYDRTQYLSHYSHTDTVSADLSQTEQFSERVKGSADIGYVTSINGFTGGISDPSLVDVLTTGQRSRRLFGNAGIDWQPTARDSFSFNANASHATYGGGRGNAAFLASDYDSYGGSAQYLRTLSERTQIGVRVNASRVDSKNYSDSDSYGPNLVLTQSLNAFWKFQGSVGAIFEHTRGPGGGTSTSVGFDGSLCGTFPRKTVCLTASRQSAPSGFGGLRTDTRYGANIDYRLSTRDRLTGHALYDRSSGRNGGVIPVLVSVDNQKFATVGVDYAHDLRERLSVGAGANYQWRDYAGFGKAHAFTVTANLNVRFGRTGS